MSLGGWLRRRADLSPPEFPGEAWSGTGVRALLAVEAGLAETIAVPPELARAGADLARRNVFGEAVHWLVEPDAPARLAQALGAALAGRRAAVYLERRALPRVEALLRRAAELRVPLVIHAAWAASDPVPLPADGAPRPVCFVPRRLQEALDLTVAGRRLAEEALRPVLLLLEQSSLLLPARTVQLCQKALLERFLGRPSDTRPVSEPAGALWFGSERRAAHAWLDPERPMALSPWMDERDLAVHQAARDLFAEDAVPSRLEPLFEDLAALTGRALVLVEGRVLPGSPHALVAFGPAAEVARYAQERSEKRPRWAVVSPLVVNPLPAREIARALAGAEAVFVLEPSGWRCGEAARALAGAFTESESPPIRTVRFYTARAADFTALYERGAELTDGAILGLETPQRATTRFPKRQVLLQQTARLRPDWERVVLAGTDVPKLPKGARAVAVVVQNDGPPESAAVELARLVEDATGPFMHGRAVEIEPGLWWLCQVGAAAPFADPGEDVPPEVICLDAAAARLLGRRLSEFAADGAVVLCRAEAAGPVAPAVSGRRVFEAAEGTPLAAVERWLREGAQAFAEIEAAPDASARERVAEAPPALVRRLATTSRTYDSLARFWSEREAPRHGGEPVERVPDPYLALPVVPALSAALEARRAAVERLPAVIAERCTACGACWAACPDSAIVAAAVKSEALLRAALDDVVAAGGLQEDPAVSQLGRALKPWAQRLDGTVAKARAREWNGQAAREALDWVLERLGADEAARARMRELGAAAVEKLAGLTLVASEAFFHEAHKAKRGGEWIAFALDEGHCQACGICAAACPERAIVLEDATPERRRRARTSWKLWEALPDTPGATIAAAIEEARLDGLSALMLSRTCALALPGGDAAEPGSGDRIALRHLVAVAEYERQRALRARVSKLEALAQRLRERIRETVERALPVEDLERLQAALAEGHERSLASLISRVEAAGESPAVDAARLNRLIVLARATERQLWEIREGPAGIGRARFGLVVAGESVARWALRFPANPFGVPAVADDAAAACDLALGLARAWAEASVREARLARRASLWCEAPADLAARERALATLGWAQLDAEERAACPLVVVVADAAEVTEQALSGLARILQSDLPVKVLLLDGLDLERDTDPALAALALRDAYVAHVSIAYPRHAFEALSEALRFDGPALVCAHAPRPRAHGFAPEATVARARLAVEARVRPLFTYDPRREGVFGTRLSLEGNPAPAEPWVATEQGEPLTPAHWAAGESRYAAAFEPAPEGSPSLAHWLSSSPEARGAVPPSLSGPSGDRLALGGFLLQAVEARAARWRLLQEWAGVVTPFTAAVRRQVEADLRGCHEAELEALRREYEAKLAAELAEEQARHVQRLRERLLELARRVVPSGQAGGGARR